MQRACLHQFSKRLFLSGLGVFFFFTHAQCDWNEDFWKNSLFLQESIPAFRQENACVLQNMLLFKLVEQDVERDAKLKIFLKRLNPVEKMNYVFPDKGYVIKKRPYSNLKEVFFWELSVILSLQEYVTPSFPLAIGRNTLIIQPFENIQCGSYLVIPSTDITQQVSIEDYWKSHLLVFVLGSSDLSGGNIGITQDGFLRFFDNEDSLGEWGEPQRVEEGVWAPFISLSFDWSQYWEVIDADLALDLTVLVASLCDKSDEIRAYGKIRSIGVDTVLERIERVKQFNFKEGSTFFDFIQFLYPKMGPGLEELSAIMSDIHGRKLGHGAALFYFMAFYTGDVLGGGITERDKDRLETWKQNYI